MRDTKADLPPALHAYVKKATIALSMAVVTDDDVPLILCNDAFSRLTQFPEPEVVGRNCRFLQGPETSTGSKQALHDFIHDPSQDASRIPVINYRRDGSTFHNVVFMSRLRDRSGAARFILASQFDMTSAMRQARMRENDVELHRSLTDIEAIGRGFGLAMFDSAQMLADSVTAIAKLALHDPQR